MYTKISKCTLFPTFPLALHKHVYSIDHEEKDTFICVGCRWCLQDNNNKYNAYIHITTIIIIIIMDFIYKGKPYQCSRTVLPKGPLGCNADLLFGIFEWLIRDEKYANSARKPLGTTVPQDENLPSCAPSGLKPSTYCILGLQHWLVHHGLTNSASRPRILINTNFTAEWM